MPAKPVAESCLRNQAVIFDTVSPLLGQTSDLLEIGSGTGQHAVYFGQRLPDLQWQTSDLPQNLGGIHLWLEEAQLDNVLPPVILDVAEKSWPIIKTDAIFTSNSLHIMSWLHVEHLFKGAGKVVRESGLLMTYGPFNYNGQYTSESNQRFDIWLKERGSEQGIRDFEAVDSLAEKAGFALQEDFEMPANNRILVWRKKGA